MLFGRTFFFRKMTMRLLLSPSSSTRPPDDDHRVLLLRYFPRERRTHRFVVFFFFFVVVVLENADCSCEQKATLFSATRRSSHSSSHANVVLAPQEHKALIFYSRVRRRKYLPTKRASPRACFIFASWSLCARTSYLPTILMTPRFTFYRFGFFVLFPRFFREKVGFSLAENHRPRRLRSIFSFFFGSVSWSDTERCHFPRWTDNHEKKSRRTQN